MRFRVTGIERGKCEVWANTHDGGRYEPLAFVLRDDAGDGKAWHWSAKHNEPPFFMPFYTYGFKTRRGCINHCIRTALLRQAERAIEQVMARPELNEILRSPTRHALHDMRRSRLFSFVEMHEMRERMGL